jgi:flagella basal body P-ring formation protein FlgA
MTGLKKISIKNLLILILLLTSGILISSPCFALEIRVKNSLKTAGDTVYLGDIATFHPADDGRVEKLKTLKVTSAPAPDSSRTIKSDLILYNIAHILNAEKDIKLQAPDIITIERTAQVIDKTTLEEIFRDYVLDNSPYERGQISIETINAPSSVALPEGELEWEIDAKHNSNFIGNLSLLIDFRVDGDSQKKIIVSGKLSVTREVVKAVRNIDRGDIITAQDVTLASEQIKYFRKDIIASTKQILGKRATRRIQADQTIKNGMFEVPPAVEKGDRVVIKAENNDLLITASGEALEEGCVGDQIRVMNVSSGREIVATVRRTDLVEVQF